MAAAGVVGLKPKAAAAAAVVTAGRTMHHTVVARPTATAPRQTSSAGPRANHAHPTARQRETAAVRVQGRGPAIVPVAQERERGIVAPARARRAPVAPAVGAIALAAGTFRAGAVAAAAE